MNVMPIRYCADVAAATRFVRSAWRSFEADEPLEAITDRLRAAGLDPGPILDDGFGRSMRVRDPDGVWVQINMFDRELYT